MSDPLSFNALKEKSNEKAPPRLLMQVELKPLQGNRFQPTGFADLGAAVYERPDGTRMLLVESAQSVANRLEQTCLEGGTGPGLAKEIEGLPYVKVKLTGATEAETSSLVEAHRINSPFIITDGDFQKKFVERAKYAEGKPLDWKSIAATFFYYDPNSLLHGAFMANLGDGRMRVPRAISGFIEAEDVREAASGGVKNNPIDPTGTIRAKDYDKDVYSNVPYHRTEFTARRIVAYFNLDLALLCGYGLPVEAFELLVALSLYKVRRFLGAGLRLRTACDLAPMDGITVTSPAGFELPTEETSLEAIKARIEACARKGLFSKPPVTELTVNTVRREKPKGKEKEKEKTDDGAGTDEDEGNENESEG